MPRASHWVTPRAAATVTGTVSQAGTPARSPICDTSAATTMLTATSRPSLTLIERMPSSGRSAFTALPGLATSPRARRLERVADAVHGAHALGADLRPQRLDVAVEGAGAAGIGPAPDLAHEVVAAADRSRLGREGEQQVELQRGEVHLGSPRRRRVARPGRRRGRRASSTAGWSRGERAGPLDPAQQGPDPGHDLAHPERLRDVVVGADAEPDEQVGLVGAGRQHEHRHGALGLDAATHLEPVEAGQHEVEHDEVGRVVGVSLHRAWPVEGLHDAKPLCHKAIRDRLVDRGVVLDDEQRRRRGRARRCWTGPLAHVLEPRSGPASRARATCGDRVKTGTVAAARCPSGVGTWGEGPSQPRSQRAKRRVTKGRKR